MSKKNCIYVRVNMPKSNNSKLNKIYLQLSLEFAQKIWKHID